MGLARGQKQCGTFSRLLIITKRWPLVQTQLLVPQIEFPVRVGCNQEERSRPQAVEFSIRLVFAEPPPGCWTDELEHTICYGKITETRGGLPKPVL